MLWNLNCLVCNRRWLPAASWLVPDPGTVCVAVLSLSLGQCSAQKRCDPRVQLPLGDQLHSDWWETRLSTKTTNTRDCKATVPLWALFFLSCQINSRAQAFFARVTVVKVTRQSQTVSRHCDVCETLFTNKKFPFITTLQSRTVTKFTKVESLVSDGISLWISEFHQFFCQQRWFSILLDTSLLSVHEATTSSATSGSFSHHN